MGLHYLASPRSQLSISDSSAGIVAVLWYFIAQMTSESQQGTGNSQARDSSKKNREDLILIFLSMTWTSPHTPTQKIYSARTPTAISLIHYTSPAIVSLLHYRASSKLSAAGTVSGVASGVSLQKGAKSATNSSISDEELAGRDVLGQRLSRR